jgi:hypothetical protein
MGTFKLSLKTGLFAVAFLLLGLGAADSYASAKFCKVEAKQCKLARDKKQYRSVAACLSDRYDDLNEACQSYVLFRKGQFAEAHAACQSDMTNYCATNKHKRKCLLTVLNKERNYRERLASGKVPKESRDVAQATPAALSPVCANKLIQLNGLAPLPAVSFTN